MNDCKNCRKKIGQGELFSCPNCGAEFCKDCAKSSKNICPYCYSNLQING